MTLDQIDSLHPNGLVDAQMASFSVDYANDTVEFRLLMRRYAPGGPRQDETEWASLCLDGCYYFVVDQPEGAHRSFPGHPVQITAYSEDESEFKLFSDVRPKLSATAFSCRFYVHDWNAFIHTAARDARLLWTDGGRGNQSKSPTVQE